MSEILDDVCGSDGPPGAPLIAGNGKAVWRTGILTGRVTDDDGNPVEDATLHLLAKAHEAALFAQVRDPATFAFEDQRVRWEEKTSSSGFYRVCWLPADLPIELVMLGEDENVDRGALRAALSLADLYPGRVTILTIDGESPHRRLDLRVEG